MEQTTGLIFDFDGVLADTERLHWRSWSEVLACYGVSLTWDEYCRYGRGVKDEQMLATLPQLAGSPQVLASVRQRLTERMNMVRTWCADELPISPQVVQLLKSLSGFRLGLVTSSERVEVEPLLKRSEIHSCFDAIVYGDDTVRHKPDPAPYLLVRERLGIAAGMAFEDSEAGLESARAAGLEVFRISDPIALPDTVHYAVLQKKG